MNNFYIIDFKEYKDERGKLIPFEYETNCPFEIKRAFLIYDVPSLSTERAGHINKYTKQIIIAISGECYVDCIDKNKKETFILKSPSKGLFINNNTYKKLYNFSKDATLLCLCSNYYNKAEYITNEIKSK